MKKTCFYYSQLPGEGAKRFYRSILYSVREQKTTARAEGTHLDRSEIEQVLYAIDYDYPELFYLSLFGEGCHFTLFENGDREMRFRYRYSLEEQRRRVRENERFIRCILSHVPDRARPSQYLTALWLHDLVAKNVRYDHAARQAGAEKQPQAYSIEGGVYGKKAVCSGIARLYMMLCERMGIWCAYVAGETRLREEDRSGNVEGAAGRHAWNLLRLDGVYTYADVTWDLQEEVPFVPHYYFGMSEEQCRRQRTPDRRFESVRLPVSPTPNPMNYYIRARCFLRSFLQLEAFLRDRTARKKERISFQLDPQGVPCDALRPRVEDWVRQFMRQADDVAGWKLWYNTAMLVFDYSVTYRTQGNGRKKES